MHSLGTGVLRSGLRKAGTWRSSRPGGQLGCSSLKCCFFPLGSNHSHLSTLLFVGPQTSTFLPKERKKLNHLQLHIQRLHSMNLASTAPGAPGHPRQVPPGADAPKTSMPTKASASGRRAIPKKCRRRAIGLDLAGSDWIEHQLPCRGAGASLSCRRTQPTAPGWGRARVQGPDKLTPSGSAGRLPASRVESGRGSGPSEFGWKRCPR